MANRDECLANMRTQIATVTGVVTVADHFVPPADVGFANMPWVGVYASQVQPAPVYEPGGQRIVNLLVDVLVYTPPSADTTEAAILAAREDTLADLDQAIEQELVFDTPTRGGWAIDTMRVGEIEANDSQPLLTGTDGRIGVMRMQYRVRYVPGEDAP